jgi:hypothetical protein
MLATGCGANVASQPFEPSERETVMNAPYYGRETTRNRDSYAAPEQAAPQPGYEQAYGKRRHRSRSLGAAATLLMLGGVLSFLTGLAALLGKAFFTSQPQYTTTVHNYAYHWNLTGWGWSSLVLGVIVVIAGIFVLLGQTWARWFGVVLALISAAGTFLFLPYYPFWSVIVIALDVFIIWALATARRRRDA